MCLLRTELLPTPIKLLLCQGSVSLLDEVRVANF